jgi:hypothetical protein
MKELNGQSLIPAIKDVELNGNYVLRDIDVYFAQYGTAVSGIKNFKDLTVTTDPTGRFQVFQIENKGVRLSSPRFSFLLPGGAKYLSKEYNSMGITTPVNQIHFLVLVTKV